MFSCKYFVSVEFPQKVPRFGLCENSTESSKVLLLRDFPWNFHRKFHGFVSVEIPLKVSPFCVGLLGQCPLFEELFLISGTLRLCCTICGTVTSCLYLFHFLRSRSTFFGWLFRKLWNCSTLCLSSWILARYHYDRSAHAQRFTFFQTDIGASNMQMLIIINQLIF